MGALALPGAVLALVLPVLDAGVRVIRQFDRGVVLRLGRAQPRTQGPGLALLVPVADHLQHADPAPAEGSDGRERAVAGC